MKMMEIASRLCHYDIRNPDGVVTYLTEDEIKEEGLTTKAKDNCLITPCYTQCGRKIKI